MTAMELSMDHRIWVLVDQESDKPATIYLEICFVLSVAIRGIVRKLVSTSNLSIYKRNYCANVTFKILFIFSALASTMEFLHVMGALDFSNGVFAED